MISWLRVITLAALAVLALAASAQGAATGFCTAGLARDYEAPLDTMRPIHRIMSANELGRSGERLSFVTTSVGRLIVGRGHVGVRLTATNRHARLPRWTLSSELVRVDARGRTTRVVARHRGALVPDRERAWEQTYAIKRHGLYRVDFVITNRHGLQLYKLSEYVRAVKPFTDVKLATDANSVVPGERIMTRLENLGTRPIYFGLEYKIERYDGFRWIEDSHTPVGFPQVGLGLAAGEKAQCEEFSVDATMSPGLYRFTKPYSVGRNSSPRLAIAEFIVQPQAQAGAY